MFATVGHLCQNLTQELDTCLVQPASFGPCFVSTFFTLMGWMHNLSLLALSILCWLPPSLSCSLCVCREGAKPGPRLSLSIWRAPEGPTAAEASTPLPFPWKDSEPKGERGGGRKHGRRKESWRQQEDENFRSGEKPCWSQAQGE